MSVEDCATYSAAGRAPRPCRARGGGDIGPASPSRVTQHYRPGGMEAVDPRDPQAVADAVAAWASERFGGAVAVDGEPSAIGAGFDSYIHRVDLTGTALPDGLARAADRAAAAVPRSGAPGGA